MEIVNPPETKKPCHRRQKSVQGGREKDILFLDCVVERNPTHARFQLAPLYCAGAVRFLHNGEDTNSREIPGFGIVGSRAFADVEIRDLSHDYLPFTRFTHLSHDLSPEGSAIILKTKMTAVAQHRSGSEFHTKILKNHGFCV